MSQTTEQWFLKYFHSRQSACAFGIPDSSKDKPGKKGMRYLTQERGFNAQDVTEHLLGRRSIVAIPLLEDGTCLWGAIDIDEQCDMPEDQDLKWFHSKSSGWHGFVFFESVQSSASVRSLLRSKAVALGFPKAEVFPKQNSAACGNGINLPYFDSYRLLLGTIPGTPVLYRKDLPEVAPEPVFLPEVEGYWDETALLAMLEAYKRLIPGFDFAPCRNGYAVPCPGHIGTWEDGAAHSTKAEKLSHETLVFIKNGWPKFRCVHAHCDGGTGDPKKTINDFRFWWDPLRKWEFDDWQLSVIMKRGEYAR